MALRLIPPEYGEAFGRDKPAYDEPTTIMAKAEARKKKTSFLIRAWSVRADFNLIARQRNTRSSIHICRAPDRHYMHIYIHTQIFL